ncbi:MAG: hypothetical protein VX223_01030, partial [Myxococcota bacterium]|nr:hypothetical protein [Myxococcota bacterium]
MVIFAQVSDDRDALNTLRVQFGSNLAGPLETVTANGSGLAELRTSDLVAGTHTITATVTDSDALEASATIDILINAPPTAPKVSITPESPTTADALVATVTAPATDVNRAGDQLTYRYQWKRDGEPAGPDADTLPSALTSKGETWLVEVKANDGLVDGPIGTAQVTIQNSAPSCAKAVMLPSSGTTETEFECTCTEWSDPDQADEAQNTCAFKDETSGATLSDGASTTGPCTLPAALTSKGMEIVCELTPGDGEAQGEPVLAEPVLVNNAAPTPPTDVALSPTEGTVETTFTCSYTASSTDADGDDIGYDIIWVVNGYENPGTTSLEVQANALSSAAGVLAQKGDTVKCRVRANDGTTPSSAVDSNPVTLGNSAPTGGAVLLTPAGATVDSTLTCDASDASDPDGDAISWTYTWEVNDVPVEDATDATLSGAFVKGDKVQCFAMPTDGELSGPAVSAKLALTIQNTLPVIHTATVTPTETNKPGTFTCTYDGWADPDTDDSPEVDYAWYLTAENAGDEPTLIEGAVADTFGPSALT